jgi:hypothetical protein
MAVAPMKYAERTALGQHLIDEDHDLLVDAYRGFTPSGTFIAAYDYIIVESVDTGVNYYSANTGSQTIYGGATLANHHVGGVDGASAAAVIQACITALGANYGAILLKNFDEPAGVTTTDKILLFSFYSGKSRFGTFKLYEDHTDANGNSFVLQGNTANSRTAFGLKPTGTPAGEWTTNFNMWNDDSRIFEISWSNDYLIQNLFHVDVTTDPHEWMWMMNSKTFLHAYYNSGVPYVDLQSAWVASTDGFQVCPDIALTFQQFTTKHLHTRIYFYHDDNWVFENLTDATVKFSVGATPVHFIYDYLGQFTLPTRLLFGNGAAAPQQSAASAGAKIDLYNTAHQYEIGIAANELWMKSDGAFKWYYNTGPALKMSLSSAGVLEPVTVKPTTSYESTDGTAGVTDDVIVRDAAGTGTTTLSFKNGLFVGHT